ncbi:hypothetical protein KFK09_008001 [Dendrobium nobile]|uniref:MHD2 domain-containing protein n=1 Tax=Dendrobium nobile TaxID=94219 RepID=A0A8T3BTD5_DENNO|nr:hypothetical protein KFK09_008001 [Dendrobium nobile]
MEPSFMLERFRNDRRKLLEFILSAGLIKGPLGDPPDLSGVDLDTVSADYVLDCVKSGGAFVPKDATSRHNSGLNLPIMISAPSGNSFFLLSKPDLLGSPPQRVAPLVGVKTTNDLLSCSTSSVGIGVKVPIPESKTSNLAPTTIPSQPTKDVKFSLGLPSFRTGLSDDDMRETAYEVLLASVVHSGGHKPCFEEKKKERKSKFLKGLRSRRDGSHFQLDDTRSDLMDTIRGQLEISEAMDAWTKKGLLNFCLRSMPNRADVPQISLELLGSLSRSDFPTERFYTQWQRRQVDMLEELLVDPTNSVASEQQMLSYLLSNIRNLEEWANLSHEVRTDTLDWIGKFISRMSSMPEKFGVSDVAYYWTGSYYFTVKLYEKLLCSVFDILEDGQIVEEAEEILGVLRMTWSMLGINQMMHDTLYGWALFQQFVRTGDVLLLKYTIVEVQQILSNIHGDSEVADVNVVCSVEVFGYRKDLNLVDAVLFNIYLWCSTQLEDYHLNFSEGDSQIFEGILTLAIISGTRFSNEIIETKVPNPSHTHPEAETENGVTSKLVRLFVERSIQRTCQRVQDALDAKSKREQKHPLALFAKELILFAEKEYTLFTPILCLQYSNAGVVFSVILHQYYLEQLKPFLEGISGFSESAIPVLSASYSLERCLANIINSTSGESKPLPITNYLDPYQIRPVSAPLILHLVNVRHEKILGWTERAILIENWEPLSSQQKQASSVIEVFRIIQEAIDQFFDLILPMETIHLRSLLIGVVRSLEAYLQHIISHQVDKSFLYPSPPTLTRYKAAVNPFMKKKPVECVTLDEKVVSQIENLTVPKLCVKLNTLKYIRDQLEELEASIKQSWVAIQTADHHIYGRSEEELTSSRESVDELFTIFDDIRTSAIGASNVILDFIGARAIFWDMRETFIYLLYRGGVKRFRLDTFLPELDGILDRICDLIIDELRDHVVLSICRASMAGYIWVMLDGGPSRAFSHTDVEILHEDLNMLKDLFEANGQGIHYDVIKEEAKQAEEILELYSMKAEAIIDKLINSSKQTYHQHDHKKPGNRGAKDADTFLRVLCHMKDENASEFLRVRYQLPKSSDYEETYGREKEQTLKSPFLSDILKGNAASNGWAETGQRSFRIMKKKIQEATSEIRQTQW